MINTVIIIVVAVLIVLVSVLFYQVKQLKKQLEETTYLSTYEENGYKIIKNSKGEEIFRL